MGGWLGWGLLVAPLIMVFVAILIRAKGFQKSWNEYISLDHKALFKQPLLWVVLFLPFAYALGAAWIALYGHPLELSARGISNFFRLSKYAIFILTPVLPLGVLVARMHSSLQTEEQIRTSEIMNSFNAFYKHMEEFTKMHSMAAASIDMVSTRPLYVYRKYFPNNTLGKSTFVSDGIESFRQELIPEVASLMSAFSEFEGIKNKDRLRAAAITKRINEVINEIYEKVGLAGKVKAVSLSLSGENLSSAPYFEKHLEMVEGGVKRALNNINDFWSDCSTFSLVNKDEYDDKLFTDEVINQIWPYVRMAYEAGHLSPVDASR